MRVCSSRGRLSNSNPLLIRGPIKYLKRRGFAFAYAMSSFNDKPGLRPGINLSNAHTYNCTLCEQRWRSVESTPSHQCRLGLSSSVDTGMSLLLNLFSAPSGFFSEHSVFAISSNTSMSKILVRSGPCTSIIE